MGCNAGEVTEGGGDIGPPVDHLFTAFAGEYGCSTGGGGGDGVIEGFATNW
jgi:hypothetical protein